MLIFGLLLASFALAACGSDDGAGSDESQGGVVSKEDFVSAADEICSDSADAQAETQSALESATNGEEAAAAYDGLADVAQGVNDEINAIGRPEGDEALIDDLAAKQDELVASVRSLADAVRADDEQAAGEVAAEFDALAAETGTISEDYGFEVC